MSHGYGTATSPVWVDQRKQWGRVVEEIREVEEKTT